MDEMMLGRGCVLFAGSTPEDRIGFRIKMGWDGWDGMNRAWGEGKYFSCVALYLYE